MPRGNPRTKTLEVRLTPAERAKLDIEAKRRGVKASALVRAQLGALIGLGQAAASAPVISARIAPAAPSSAQPPAGVPIDFAVWLSGRTGMPKALARRAISAGRVTIDGVKWTSLKAGSLDANSGQVELDGNPV